MLHSQENMILLSTFLERLFNTIKRPDYIKLIFGQEQSPSQEELLMRNIYDCIVAFLGYQVYLYKFISWVKMDILELK